jgi:hypothetical protein
VTVIRYAPYVHGLEPPGGIAPTRMGEAAWLLPAVGLFLVGDVGSDGWMQSVDERIGSVVKRCELLARGLVEDAVGTTQPRAIVAHEKF